MLQVAEIATKDPFESISHCVHKVHQSYQQGCIYIAENKNTKRGNPILDDTSPLINNAYSIANDLIIKYPVNKLLFVGTVRIPGSYWRITVCFSVSYVDSADY